MTAISLQTKWIDNGNPVDNLTPNPFQDCSMPFRTLKLAKVQIIMLASGNTATLVEWDTDHIPPSSLDYLATKIEGLPAPFIFRFFNRAWFSEHHKTIDAATARLDELKTLHNLVVPFNVYQKRRNLKELPQNILDAAHNPKAISPLLVRSHADQEGIFPVTFVGKESVYARVTGSSGKITPNDEIDKNISTLTPSLLAPYLTALETGEIYWDEFLGYVPANDTDEPFWLRANRLLIPHKRADGEWEILSLCVQGETNPNLITFGANTGFEIPTNILPKLNPIS